MTITCSKTGCLVANSTRCLRDIEPPESCEFYEDSDTEEDEKEEAETEETKVADAGESYEFHLGIELGYDDALVITRNSYAHVLTILGETEVGKTCLLTCFYILAIRKRLSGYLFSGSLTLPAFEQRARHARQWEAGIPKSMPSHTNLADKRSPAFLHLQLQGEGDTKQYSDVLFTDLPGEWTADLMDREDTHTQFSFIHRSDAILILIDASKLTKTASGNVQIRNAEVLFERLAKNLNLDRTIPIYLVLAKSDLVAMKVPAAVEKIKSAAAQHGFSLKIHQVAAWSTTTKTKAGTGVEKLLLDILSTRDRPKLSPAPRDLKARLRQFLQVRVND